VRKNQQQHRRQRQRLQQQLPLRPSQQRLKSREAVRQEARHRPQRRILSPRIVFERIVSPTTKKKRKNLREMPVALSVGEEMDQVRLKLRGEKRHQASGAPGAIPMAAERTSARLDL
jgi:hypothetical protein